MVMVLSLKDRLSCAQPGAPASAVKAAAISSVARCGLMPLLPYSATPVRGGSSDGPVALGHDAAQQPALGAGEIGARMQAAAIVPQHEIADAPFVAVDELRLLDMLEQRIEQGV